MNVILKKKLMLYIGCLSLVLSICGCGKAKKDTTSETTEIIVEAENIPDLTKIKSICELATLKCYYHNIAKSVKTGGSGLMHSFEKDRKFWIEYTGVVEISYRTELIEMEQDGTNITITLPEPDIECVIDPDSWNEDSYVVVKDQLIQKNPITANDQTTAINNSIEALEADVRNNSALVATAELQAKALIENYIYQIGEATGIKYNVTWKSKKDEAAAVN